MNCENCENCGVKLTDDNRSLELEGYCEECEWDIRDEILKD